MRSFLQSITARAQQLRHSLDRQPSGGDRAKVPDPVASPPSLRSPSAESPLRLRFEVSTSQILHWLLVCALFYVGVQAFVLIQSTVIITTIAFFFAIALSPAVDWLEHYRLPRPLAILLLYCAFFSVMGLIFAMVIPILAAELYAISVDLRALFAQSGSSLDFLQPVLNTLGFEVTELQSLLTDQLANFSQALGSVAGSTLAIVSALFSGIFNFIYCLALLFFILLEKESIADFLISVLPLERQGYFLQKFSEVQSQINEWFKGQLILMLSVGLFTFVGMKLLEIFFGMKYAATIGLVAGVMELFPYIGVMITGLLSTLVALNISWLLTVLVIGWTGLTQFLEGNLLVPRVMSSAVSLSSVVVILALPIGGTIGQAIGGLPLAILGMIFAIPVAATVALFVKEYVRDLHQHDPAPGQ